MSHDHPRPRRARQRALKPATLHARQRRAARSAATCTSSSPGQAAQAAAQAAARSRASPRCCVADAPHYADPLAENLAALVARCWRRTTRTSSRRRPTFGKNFMPRVAALLDVAQVSDIIAVESARHVRAADLRRQRVRDRAVEGSDQGRHRAHDGVRRGAGDRRQRARSNRFAAAPDTGLSQVVGQELTKSRAAGADRGADRHLRRPRPGQRRELQAARGARRQARTRDRCVARGGRRGLRAQRLPGRPDRQDRRARPVHRGRHLRARSSTWRA